MSGRSGSGLRWASLPFWAPLAFLGVWQLASGLKMLDPIFFPPPTRLLQVAFALIGSGELGSNVAATLSRAFTGYSIGVACGLVAGVLMGVLPPVRRALEPVVSALYTTPKMTLLPLAMLLVGVSDTARLSLVALGAFLNVVINTLDGLLQVDPHYVEMATNYGAPRSEIIRRVYLPCSLPQVFTGLRLAFGRALVTTITIELISSPNGLGHMVWMAWQTFTPENLYIGVLTCAALGGMSHATLRAAERRLSPWRSE